MDSSGASSIYSEFDSGHHLQKYAAPTAVDSAVEPGESATIYVLQNARDRRVWASVLKRYETDGDITRSTYDAAKAMLEALPRDKALPRVAPDGDGGLMTTWSLEDRSRTLLTIDGWFFHCVSGARTQNVTYHDVFEFDGGNLPGWMLQVLA
jgi:hypothetical protein